MIRLHITTACWTTEKDVKPEEVAGIVAYYKANYPGVNITSWPVKVENE